MKKSVYIYTYGCQMNVHDSEKMMGILSDNGYRQAETPETADLIIFNTCAIREKAEQKFYSQLGRAKFLKRKKRGLKIAVAGCVAQDTGKKIFSRASYVDYVIGPQNISMITDIMKKESGILIDDNPLIQDEEFNVKRESNIKAWVSIMYGCNNFCSYCIVPYTRGREHSRPAFSIIKEIEKLKNDGFKEVTLLGQNVNSYRSEMNFVELLRQIDIIGIPRVRFVTSHPRDLSDDLINAFTEFSSLCEHIHLPLQSGSNNILKAMNRGYTYQDYVVKIEKLRKKVPSISITSDIIVGFPGESSKDYQDTLSAINNIKFDGIFAFKYSKRKGTKAYEMDNHLPEEEKTERLNYLLKIQDEITLSKNKTLEGSIQEILIEGTSDTDQDKLMGRTRTNKIVTIPDIGDKRAKIGLFIDVLIKKARHHSLEALAINSTDPLR